jgi:hypothetical protein
MKKAPRRRRVEPSGRWGRRLRPGLCAVASAFALYVALIVHPDPLFAYELQANSIVLHAREPLPPEAAGLAQAAHARIARSPFFVEGDSYHVYLCDSPALFSFLSLKPGVGAVAQVYFVGQVLLRPSHIARDRLIGPSGNEVPGERTLTYYIAHEITHSMVARRIGRVAYARLADWQREGYADYVAKAGSFDFEVALADFRADARDLDPVRSGLYLRYQLLTVYALDQLRLSAEELMNGYRPPEPLEATLRRPGWPEGSSR